MKNAARPNWAALTLFLLALIAAAPLWGGPGMVNTRAGGDSPFLFIRLHQLVENLRAGAFPVRWMPDAAYGLGYPFFNFYAALPYYFAALFNLIGFDLLASIKIVQSLGFVFAAWAMYGWIRSATESATRVVSHTQAASSNAGAWLAAAAYTFAPFHLVNVYLRGDSLSEFYAFVFYPLILWAIDGALARPRPRSIAALALAYGGLILTHNVSALIFSPFVLAYVAIRGWRSGPRDWRARAERFLHSPFSILHSFLALALGLLLSAWFWLPALGEAQLVQLDVQTTGYFNYAGHFRSTNLIQSSIGFDYDTSPPRTPFAMGLVQAIVTLAGAATMIAARRRGSTRLRLFVLAGLVVSTFMITPLSKPVWDSMPLLPLAQFPWRFLSVQALFASAAIGFLGSASSDASYRAGAIGLALATSTLLPLRPDYLPIRADEITSSRIQLYEAFTTNVGTTIRAEYLPRTTTPRPYTGPALIDPDAAPRAIAVRGEAEATLIAHGPIAQTWQVHAASDSTLAFPLLYFPGWQASLDGQAIEVRAAVDLGHIEIDAPAGEHTLAFTLGRTPIRALAEAISLAALLGLLVMLLAFKEPVHEEHEGAQRRIKKLRVPSWPSWIKNRTSRVLLLAFALTCALAAIASAANAVEARDDDLTMDFESKPWLHHGAVDLGAARLLRYEFAGPLAAGRPFDVMLEWSDVSSGASARLALVAPSSHVFGEPEPLAIASAPIRPGANTYTLAVPAWLARNTYYIRVEAIDVAGAQRTVFLRPVGNADPARTPDAPAWAQIADAIRLDAVHLKHDTIDQLTVAFDWSAAKPIAANYAVSLRLQDETGRVWASLDTQPGYGFLPTSVWRPGETQHDVYTLALPEDAPRTARYSLDAVWYRFAAQQEIGRVRVPNISIASLYAEREAPPPARNFNPPAMAHRVDATFGGAIRLLGFDWTQSDRRARLTLHWQAVIDIDMDYKFFVHVFDPTTEKILAQVDAMPGGNAYPTSRWVMGEVVSESFELELGAEAEPGRVYQVGAGWYEPGQSDRLPAIDARGDPVPGDRVILISWPIAP